MKIDPKLDLVLERIIDVAPQAVWDAWTRPEQLMPWFCPKPWQTVECEIDLQPGGQFYTLMRGPAGEEMPNHGCYLEVVPNRKLSWTNALLPGFRPAKLGSGPMDFAFTAVVMVEPHGTGTKYTAVAIHAEEESRNSHAAMGFEQGWGTALDQMVAMIKG